MLALNVRLNSPPSKFQKRFSHPFLNCELSFHPWAISAKALTCSRKVRPLAQLATTSRECQLGKAATYATPGSKPPHGPASALFLNVKPAIKLNIDTNIAISYVDVGGSILKCPLKFQLPNVHAPHSPLPSSAGGACEYDGRVITLLAYGYDCRRPEGTGRQRDALLLP